MFNILKPSKTIAKSGILQGYTDYHCHLLPGVDDGVQTPEETLAILELMHSQGVKEVWFTPHVMEEMPNTPEDLKTKFQEFHSSLPFGEGRGEVSLPFGGVGGGLLHLAAEHMLDSEFSLDRALQLPISPFRGTKGAFLLVETSYFSPPFNLKTILKEILQSGIYPLLAHPCRYRYMSLADYEELHAMGVHFQLNLPAITGQYGPDVKKRAEWILSHGYYYLTGTDTHSIASYRNFLNQKISNKTLKQLETLLSPPTPKG